MAQNVLSQMFFLNGTQPLRAAASALAAGFAVLCLLVIVSGWVWVITPLVRALNRLRGWQ